MSTKQSDEEFEYSILIDDITFYYKIIKANRKTITAKIFVDNKLIVKAPLGYSKIKVETFLKEKSKLIIKHLAKIQCQKK